MDLLSLVLTLHPLGQPTPEKPLPRWWGRSAHALLLNTIRRYDDRLAASLHEAPQSDASQIENPQSSFDDPTSSFSNPVRPFTASTLIGRFPQEGLDTERPYLLRLTTFQEQVTAILWNASREGGPLAAGQIIELDYLPFRIQAVEPALAPQPPLPKMGDGEQCVAGQAFEPARSSHPPPPNLGEGERGDEGANPWAAATSYQELSAPYLLAKIPAPRRISMQFTSPTTFKSGGKHVPLPLPELVFGSLLDRWNAYAPIAFPAEVKRYAAECLAISQYKLSSRPVPQKSGGLRLGAVGEITYAALNYDRYWMSVIATLAAFALFSGVGAGTTQGLGQGRRVE